MVLTETESRQLNAWVREHCNFAGESCTVQPKDLMGSGKLVPYIGWMWRYVDFTRPRITLGLCGFSESCWFGFMENNKWGYPEELATEDGTAALVGALLALREDPTTSSYRAVFDAVQDAGEEVLTPFMIDECRREAVEDGILCGECLNPEAWMSSGYSQDKGCWVTTCAGCGSRIRR